MQTAGIRPVDPVSIPPALITATAVATGLVGGLLIGARGGLGLAFLLAVLYIQLAIVNLPIALALWVPLVVLQRLPQVGLGSNMALVVLVMGWLGMLAYAGLDRSEYFRDRKLAIGVTLVLLMWITLSLLWAADAGVAGAGLGRWWTCGLTLLLVATIVTKTRDAQLVAAAFVASMVISTLIGFINPAATDQTALELASEAGGGRLSGASGDPNYLAAGIVPALVLVAGLVERGRPMRNLALAAITAILGVGLAATQSRGGLIAAVVTIFAALFFFRSRRPYVILVVLVLVSAAAAWFSVNPAGWERLTSFDQGGNGRTELWSIGMRMSEDHPVTGVGVENFVLFSPRYVRQPGSLEFVAFTERPYVPHNVYIGFLAETGVVGVGLFLALLAICMAAAGKAARRFEARGELQAAALAQAALVAILAHAVASIFISNATDRRGWILLALGPALLAVSRRREPSPRLG